MARKFEFGELNPNIIARNGPQLDPARFSAYHVQQKVLEDYITPQGFRHVSGWLRGIVLRVETPSTDNAFGAYHGANDIVKEPLVKLKVRIPELHPYPDPEIYGPEGDDGIISLYPTFVAINADLPTPAVGEIVYVDYGDRENFEDPRYYGLVFNKPIFGGVNVTKQINNLTNLFDGSLSKLSDFLTPPSNGNDPIPLQQDSKDNSTNDILHIVNDFWQGDNRWGADILGFGTTDLSDGGCLITALTVGANSLNGTSITPKQANTLCKNSRAFDGSNLIVPTAATALHIQAPVDKKVVGGSTQSMKDALDAALDQGGMAIMHVDFTGDTQGDHFILIHSRQNGSYIASDPALGTPIPIGQDLTGTATWGKQNIKKYTPVAIIPILKAA